MKNLFYSISKDNRGSIAGLGIIVLAATITGALYMSKKGLAIKKQSGDLISITRLTPIKEKLSRLGGYLIASNLIICKSTTWQNGQIGKTCTWSGQNAAGSNIYSPSKFFFKNERMENNYLKFDLDIAKLFPRGSNLTKQNSWVSFKLKSKSEINIDFGKANSSLQSFDLDKYYVEMVASLEYKDSKGKAHSSQFKSVFRRPIAIPKIKISSSSCVARCDVAVTENPNPACRSPQYNDPTSQTEVKGYVRNLGPGTLYKLGYERTMNYGPGSGPSGQAAETIPTEMSVFPTSKIILANATETWADQFPCGYSTATVNSVRYVMNSSKLFKNLKNIKIVDLLNDLFAPKANAVWRTVYAGTTSSTSQHAFQSGSVNYKMNGTSANASIEPYKMVEATGLNNQGVNGLQDVTTVTKLFRRVWVQPSH